MESGMAPSVFPKLPEPREVPPAPTTSAPSEPVPEAASSDAPPAVPPTSEPPITIPGAEYRALLASFQTLTTTQTTIMERMDHFQLQQDQQTLILREIQQHLGLVPPAPPIAVPSSVPEEDPSYPPRSLLLDHTITPLLFFVSIFYLFGCLIYFGPLLYWDWMYSMFLLYIVLSQFI